MASAPHVTDAEAQACADFAANVAEYLHLPRYKMLIMEEPCQDDALASVEVVEGRWVAQIYLSTEWMEKDDEERMLTIVHEVCHLLHRSVNYVVESSVRYMHDYEYNDLAVRYRHETELMVDHLSMFLSDHATIKESWKTAHRRAAQTTKKPAKIPINKP